LAKRADLNDDWTVDLTDLVILIEAWGTNDSLADVAPAAKRDGIVDERDLGLLMEYWPPLHWLCQGPRGRDLFHWLG